MLVCLATNPNDCDRCDDLLRWMGELQPDYSKHWLLLIGALTLDEDVIRQLADTARRCGFRQAVSIRAKEEPSNPWPEAANSMWHLAAAYAQDHARCAWLWVEPDTAPLREGWLDAIEAEYKSSRKPFMGALYDHPWKHLNGVAVYPENIRKFNPLYFNAEFAGLPFDVIRPELTLRHAHITNLIHRSLEDPATNTAHTFPDLPSLSIIPKEAVLFHGCKNGSLIARLREARNPDFVPPIPANGHSKPPHINLLSAVRHKVSAMIHGCREFMHSGNIGDIVYSLAAIKAFGGGDLIICPEQRKTAICTVPINQSQFEIFRPLLEEQPYLKNVRFSQKYPAGTIYDLNQFRNAWTDHALKRREGLDTLCKAHFWTMGIMDRFKDDDTWLTVRDPIDTNKIVVARSPRYNSPDFPWKRLVEQRQKDILFIGLKAEHEKFERDFGKTVSFWQVTNLLEMARLIAGAKACVMNQSSPLSIAIGVGQRVIAEECQRSPDCRFHRDSYTGHLVVGADKLNFLEL